MLNDKTGKGLHYLIKALNIGEEQFLIESAEYLEWICDQNLVSKYSEPILRSYSSLAFESAGESPRSKRSYFKLFFLSMPLHDIFGSIELSKKWTQIISKYGTREIKSFEKETEGIFELIKRRQEEERSYTVIQDNSNFIIALGILELLRKYVKYLTHEIPLIELIEFNNSLSEFNNILDIESWLSIFTKLLSNTINYNIEHSIIKLNLPRSFEQKIIHKGISELWKPQIEAIDKGLMQNQNLVYSTETGSGKSLLAYLLSSKATPENKVIYISPTKTLTKEAYNTINELLKDENKKIAISTRDETKYDDKLFESSIILSTYEKFYSIMKKNQIKRENINTLVADEVHFLSDPERGIPLEFALTDMKTTDKKPQIVSLSAMIKNEDAINLSEWLDAKLVYKKWHPIKVIEKIYYNNKYYIKDDNTIVDKKMYSKKGPKYNQRLSILLPILRSRLIDHGQIMVVVNSRKNAEKVALEVTNYIERSKFFDLDLKKQLSIHQNKFDEIIKILNNSEPILPTCAKKLLQTVKTGVAYHHGGLSEKYREIVENAVKNRSVNVLVTTTTFEVGVNLPFSAVVFMDMKVGNQPMQIITYKNLAGRTGRPQYDTNGESIILCIDEVELRDYKKKYFESDIGELDSGLQYFLKKRPNPRYAVQSQILQIASNTKRSSNKEIVNNMRKTWFWKKSTNEDKSKFVKGIDIELWNLRNYGYIRGPNEDFELTYYGKYAKNVMLTPFTLRNLISNTRRILEAKRDQEEKTLLLLSLVGLPTELSNIDPFIKKIKTDKKYEFVLDVLYQDDILTEPTERMKNCPKFAKILWEWINEEPIEDILENNNLDKTADSALLEEILPQNSFWILNTIKDIPDSLIDMEALDREYLDFLAQSCKYGSLDPLHHEFRNLDLKYLGRQSIILLVDYMKRNLLNIEDLTETDFLDVFSNNKESAKKAFNELQFTLKNT